MASKTSFFPFALLMLSLASMAFSASLSTNFYHEICPQALPAIKRVVEEAVQQERRMGASLLRLHFHDCFVNVRWLFIIFQSWGRLHNYMLHQFDWWYKIVLLHICRAAMGPYFLTRHRALRARSSHWPTTTPLEGSRSLTGSSGKSTELAAAPSFRAPIF